MLSSQILIIPLLQSIYRCLPKGGSQPENPRRRRNLKNCVFLFLSSSSDQHRGETRGRKTEIRQQLQPASGVPSLSPEIFPEIALAQEDMMNIGKAGKRGGREKKKKRAKGRQGDEGIKQPQPATIAATHSFSSLQKEGEKTPRPS
jgi:hypothetical protein